MSNLSNPESRTERFLAKAAGLDVTTPVGEYSRLERYLALIAEGAGGLSQLDYTPEQINSLLSMVNAAPSTGGFAPAGFGLGSTGETFISNLNNAVKGGFYRYGTSASNSPYSASGVLLVLPYGGDNNLCLQIAVVFAGGSTNSAANCIAVRQKSVLAVGVYDWGEWEWIAPPNQLNVEYRTTGRYLQHPVYQALISLPTGVFEAGTHDVYLNGTNGSVNYGIVRALSVDVINASNGSYALRNSKQFEEVSISAGNGWLRIAVATGGLLSGVNGTALIKYTKE